MMKRTIEALMCFSLFLFSFSVFLFLPSIAMAEEAAKEAAEEAVEDAAGNATEVAPAPSSWASSFASSFVSSLSEPIFGRYHIQLNFHNSPEFDDGLKYYDDMYGKTGRYGTFGADYTPWGWFVNLGFGLRSGIYRDSGHAASSVSSTTDEVTLDDNGKTTLTLLPFQFLVIARMTPFPAKWIVLEAYYGRERADFQEVRDVLSTSSAMSKSGRQVQSGVVGDSALTNKGWLSGNVSGAAVHILMNPLDERSVRSMVNSLGLGFVYLTLFKEQVTYLDRDRISFGRSSSGIGFAFETVN